MRTGKGVPPLGCGVPPQGAARAVHPKIGGGPPRFGRKCFPAHGSLLYPPSVTGGFHDPWTCRSPPLNPEALRVARSALAHAAEVGRLALGSVYGGDPGGFDTDVAEGAPALVSWAMEVGLDEPWVRACVRLVLGRGVATDLLPTPSGGGGANWKNAI